MTTDHLNAIAALAAIAEALGGTAAAALQARSRDLSTRATAPYVTHDPVVLCVLCSRYGTVSRANGPGQLHELTGCRNAPMCVACIQETDKVQAGTVVCACQGGDAR